MSDPAGQNQPGGAPPDNNNNNNNNPAPSGGEQQGGQQGGQPQQGGENNNNNGGGQQPQGGENNNNGGQQQQGGNNNNNNGGQQPQGGDNNNNGGQQPQQQSSQAPAQSSASGQPDQQPSASQPPPDASASASGESSGQSETPTSTYYPTTYHRDPTAFAGSSAEEGAQSNKSLSQAAIGGIAGGVVGAIAIAVLAVIIWRMCRGKGRKIPPPPPREVALPAPSFGSPRMSMSHKRINSFSTLTTRPSSHFHSHLSPASSTRFANHATPSGSPSLSSNGTGTYTPANVPMMVPVDSGLPRQGSTASSTSMAGAALMEHDPTNSNRLQRPSSSDQLRAPTPSDGPSMYGGSDSRTNTSESGANSPRSSVMGYPRRPSGSMSSLRGPIRPMGGAPHQGRSISITLPRPLSLASDGLASPTQGGTATSAISRGSYYAGGNYTPRQSMGDFGQMSMPASPSNHRRGPSLSSITSRAEQMPHEAFENDRDFAGREEIV